MYSLQLINLGLGYKIMSYNMWCQISIKNWEGGDFTHEGF